MRATLGKNFTWVVISALATTLAAVVALCALIGSGDRDGQQQASPAATAGRDSADGETRNGDDVGGNQVGGDTVDGDSSNTTCTTTNGSCYFGTDGKPGAGAIDERADEDFVESEYRPVNPEAVSVGPWPFYVVRDLEKGLWVRSGPGRDDHHIGLAPHRRTLYVDCQKVSRFDPEPGMNRGRTWLRVRWPSPVPSDAPMVSQPSDRPVGWVYAYYVTPSGTNGSVPACEAPSSTE